jgi:hypothetical protein
MGFLLFSYLVRGQEYLPLLKDNKVWSIGHEKHTIIGDTVINETTYKKLFFHNYLAVFTPDSLKYIAALREDTINKKVYFVWKDFNSEVLLYDFSLIKGESFQVKIPEFNLSGPSYFEHNINPRNLEVLMVFDSVFEGKTRKVLKLSRHQDNYPVDYWIEGIGSPYGLIYAGFEVIPGVYPILLCMYENNQLVYQINDPAGYYVDTCYVELVSNINELSDKNLKLVISPTLFRGSLNILSETPLNEITIYNLNGGIIYQYRASEGFDQHIIETGHWESGLYITRAGNSQNYVSKKIIKL